MKAEKGLSLVLDIQSNFIRGTLIYFDKNNRPNLIYSAFKSFPHKSEARGEYMTKIMLKSLEEISAGIIKEGMTLLKSYDHPDGPIRESIQNAHYILSSPWVVTKLKEIKIEGDREKEISKETIQEIIDEEKNAIAEKFHADLVLVEQKIFDVKLNGYSVSSYWGKRAKNISLSSAFALSSEHLMKKIQAAVWKSAHVANEHYHSAILLQYIALRTLYKNKSDYIIINIHGELSDVAVIKRGLNAYVGSFPFGVTTLERKLSLALKCSMEAGESNLTLYDEKKLEMEHKNRVEKALEPLVKGWQVKCLQSFEGIGKDVLLPKLVYLSSYKFPNIFETALREKGFEVKAEKNSPLEMYIAAIKDITEM